MFNKTRQQVSTLTLSNTGKKIFQAMYFGQSSGESTNDDTAKIRVSELMSKMAFYYEQIRNSVDYREEFVLRKSAIVRILKRLIVIEGGIKGDSEDAVNLAKTLLIELIRAGYLPNNTLPETKIAEIATILNKYIKLRRAVFYYWQQNNSDRNKNDGRQEFTNWVIGLAASETEENLNRNKSNDAMVVSMYEVLKKTVELPPELPYRDDLSIQIYLSIYRNYLKLNDEQVLSFVLWGYYWPTWITADDALINQIALDIDQVRRAVEFQLEHPLKSQLNKIIYKYTVYYQILQDIIEQNPKKVYEEMHRDNRYLNTKIREACSKRYKTVKRKLWGSAVRSIIYIFLTKSVLAVVLEIPAVKFFGEELNPLTLLINVSAPAVLLFLAVALTKLPGDNNTSKIIAGIEEIVFVEKARRNTILLKNPISKKGVLGLIFTMIYAATFLLTFGVIIWALNKVQFSWVSIIIFLFFLVFASFFAIRIKRGARSLVVVEDRETIFTFLWSFFYMPIISTGKWLSGKFQSINIFVFIFDFIIEAPFKVFVRIAEEWSKYLNERRENIN